MAKKSILQCLQDLRDDLKEWAKINIDVKVPMSSKINNKDLTQDIILTPEDIGIDINIFDIDYEKDLYFDPEEILG